jgi:streptogramin lyase
MRLALASVAAGIFALGGGSPQLIGTITTGRAPCGAVAAFGSVWVANDGGTLVRIDPRTNRITKRIRVGAGACSLAASKNALWIANYKRGLTRVTRKGRVKTVTVGSMAFDALVAYGRVWVTAWEAGKLAVVEPKTLRVVRRVDVGPRPVGLAVRNGALWVGFGRDATSIARVDPTTFAVDKFDVGVRAPGWFVVGTRDLWIQANDGDLVHFDPIARRVLAHLEVGATLAHGAVAQDGTIWMPDKERNVVYRVDPNRERVLGSFPAGPGAFNALRAFRSMWITSYAGSDIRRFKP